MNNAQLINQDSRAFEYYTPPEIVDLAREVMKFITLDPASSAKANETVMASIYMTEDNDSLNKDWFGNVWMNHPFSRINNPLWINKLINEYEKGHMSQACCITFAATSEVWFRPLLGHLQCFIHRRTNYYLPDGTKKKGVTKGSVVTYLGHSEDKFRRVFSAIGTVK